MANRKHLEVFEQGVYHWNEWREDHPDAVPDLTQAYLREANLVGYNLREANLQSAMLLGADLSNADLRRANLAEADMRYVELNGARLAGARFDRTKGVTAGMLRRAQRPMRLQRKLSASIVPTLVAAVAVIAVVLIVKGLSWVSAGAGEEPPAPEAPVAAASTAVSESARQLIGLLQSLRFGDWSVLQAALRGSVLTLHLDVDEVNETVYLPTLAAACGALEGSSVVTQVREIRILERTGSSGWAYDRPRNCPAIMQAPTHMLRLAAGADSLRWRARGAASP